ncbi:hypothetical protein PoB_007040800 [Plakobranchus ocellatus]|uniref:Uncharacterized protein n=1 Tax=Plakobranchus ocellatus TaxID=259542 RepID=A0AAV4DI55_9GAST|nr:hypothetical protein PoB_007040800 [Plakobranchus ocellatus]
MVGGGVILAILIIACYMFMRRSERELQAAGDLFTSARSLNFGLPVYSSACVLVSQCVARLEEAKAVNRACQNNSTQACSHAESHSTAQDLNLPPPTYGEVMGTFARCQSCDSTLAQQQQTLVCQLAQLNPSTSLPELVDISQFLAQHRRDNFEPCCPEAREYSAQMDVWAGQPRQQRQPLPPPVSEAAQWNKLPTYEEYTSLALSPTNVIDGQRIRHPTQVNQHKIDLCTAANIPCQETSSLRRPVEIGPRNAGEGYTYCGSCTTGCDPSRSCETNEPQPMLSTQCTSQDGGIHAFTKVDNVIRVMEDSYGLRASDETVASLSEETTEEPQGKLRKSCEELPSIQEADEESHTDGLVATNQTGKNSKPESCAKEHEPTPSCDNPEATELLDQSDQTLTGGQAKAGVKVLQETVSCSNLAGNKEGQVIVADERHLDDKVCSDQDGSDDGDSKAVAKNTSDTENNPVVTNDKNNDDGVIGKQSIAASSFEKDKTEAIVDSGNEDKSKKNDNSSDVGVKDNQIATTHNYNEKSL